MSEQTDDPDGLNDLAFCHRVACYLDGESSQDELRSLDAELQADGSKRDAFVRLCLVRVALIRHGTAIRAETPMPDPLGLLDDAVILPALRDSDVEDHASANGPVVDSPGSGAGRPEVGSRPLGRWWVFGAGMAAMLVIGFGLHWVRQRDRHSVLAGVIVPPPAARQPVRSQPPQQPPRREPAPPLPPPPPPPPPPAVVTATAGVAVDGPDLLVPKLPLVAGRSVRLTRGAAELTFASGAVVLVRAPASVRIVDADELVVNSGSVYAHVPPAAHGFRVMSQGLDVVDRGTNFGLRAGAEAAATEVHVFEGRVDATGVDASGRATAAPVEVTTGNAVSHAVNAIGAQPVPVPFASVTFDRNIADIRLAVATHGSGAGLVGGAADPNWKIISMPGMAEGQSQPAAVLENPRPDYVKDRPDAGWIGPTARLSNAAPGKYVYRTTLDLTGYNAASVSATTVMSADDLIVDVRVNGTPVVLPPPGDQPQWRSLSEGTLDGGPWRSGLNQLDVTVYNGTAGTRMNPTGLLFGWTLTAAPLVRR